MRSKTRILALASLAGAFSLAGCHGFLDVQNPGPIDDSALYTPDAVPALVVGMSADLSDIYSFIVRIDAIASDEMGHGGSYTPEGLWVRGIIRPEDVNDYWARMQRVRFEAESGVDRMKGIKGFKYDTDANAARANLLGGFANRLLGESACQAVINDGPVQSDTTYFQRAEAEFTEAIRIAGAATNATDILTAAYGGRASVRAWQGNWAAAVQDAQQVPTNFVYNAIYSINSTRENNSLVQETYVRREFSLFGTMWAQVFKDPRVPWDTIKTTTGAIQTGQDGKTPYFRQAKYTSLGSAIPLVKGTEMLVLQAEAALRNGDITTAFTLINQERAFYKMAALTAPADLPTAWQTLEFERGAVVWLEARRLWDLRRWFVDPGPAHNDFLNGRDKSIPISQAEYQTNPNLISQTPKECQ
ncbi:MAG TPA: RagB/SusD family nutrient uptake outer membrane protein [Gemmatimonadaceae bacterium]